MCSGGTKASEAPELEPLKTVGATDQTKGAAETYRQQMLRRGILSNFNRAGVASAPTGGATAGTGSTLGG